jgi:hypothetical protein
MTSTIHSEPLHIEMLSFVGFDISWTGSPTGTFSVEVSNTYTLNADGSPGKPGNWTALTLSAAVTASGSPGNAFIDIDAISAAFIRLTYTPSSGTGTLNAVATAKVS